MNSKQLHGLPVLTIDDGAQIATVARAYVDVATRRIAGFALHVKTGLFEPDSEPKLDAEKVHTLGSGGLMLDDRSAAQGASIEARLGELVTLDDWTNRPILTEDGVAIGHVASVDFDEHSFELTRLETSAGLFKSTSTIAIDDVLTIGPEYVIVTSAVASGDYAAEERPATPASTSRRIRWVEAGPEPTPETEPTPGSGPKPKSRPKPRPKPKPQSA